MRSILLTLWLAVLGLVLVCPSVPAADPIDVKPPQPALGGGLNISLVTSGYRFNEFLPAAPKAKDSFVASVSLSNRSRTPIPFSFNDAGPRWTFRVLNSEDEEVWKSNADVVSAQVITEEVLGPGKSWKMSVRIPLAVDGLALPVGDYTVQAFLNADKSVSATSAFEVVAGPGSDTGIKGQVLRPVLSNPETNTVSEIPAGAGVQIRVDEITPGKRSPFSWMGMTNTEGRFTVNAPAGVYRVTAYDRLVWPVYPQGNVIVVGGFPSASIVATVQDGAFSEVTLRLNLTQPPEITQGITGTVRPVGNQIDLTTAEAADAPPVFTLPGFIVRNYKPSFVRITQIDLPAGTAPFEWSGYTDVFGRFRVATPQGRFVVFATEVALPLPTPPAPGILPASDSETVTVEGSRVTTVNLDLTSGSVIPSGN